MDDMAGDQLYAQVHKKEKRKKKVKEAVDDIYPLESDVTASAK